MYANLSRYKCQKEYYIKLGKAKTPFRDFRFWRKSFLSKNKNLEYKIYDDGDNERLFLSKAPGLSDLYRQFPAEIYRVDIVRALYLFCFGGLYADMDFQCLQPLNDIFESESDIILGRMGINKNFAHSIPNAWMASNKHQGFWLGYLDEVHRRWGNRESLPTIRPEHVTGLIALKSTALRYQNEPADFRKRVLSFIERLDLDMESNQIRWGGD